MTKTPFVVAPSRKPRFWLDVERHRKAAEKATKKVAEPAPVKKPAAKKKARK